MWRLQNDFTRGSTAPVAAPEVPDDEPSFTEFTLDVKT